MTIEFPQAAGLDLCEKSEETGNYRVPEKLFPVGAAILSLMSQKMRGMHN